MTRPPKAVRLAAGAAVSVHSAQRRLLLLSATRWLPVGLTLGVIVLLPLQRGITVAQLGVILSAQGFVVLALELPTGGLADALGRRPMLVGAAAVGILAGLVFVTASTFAMFVVALALQGVYRALDSGPLEAWFVDTVHAQEPEFAVEGALGRAGAVLGVAIAGGAVTSGALVAWHPLSGSALVLPYVVALVLQGGHLVLTAALVREPARIRDEPSPIWASVRGAPQTVVAGVGLLRTDRVLRWLVGVEVFWAVGMIGFETLYPVRLAELVGGEARAGALYGPVAAVAWGLFAVGSWLAGVTARRLGVAWTAILARVLNGGMVVAMGVTAGPLGLVVAYLAAYALHGANSPVHATLLHRRAASANRATVLSMNSMVSGACYSLGLLVLGPLAEHTSTGTAIVVAGSFSMLGAVLYRPALRASKTTSAGSGGVPTDR